MGERPQYKAPKQILLRSKVSVLVASVVHDEKIREDRGPSSLQGPDVPTEDILKREKSTGTRFSHRGPERNKMKSNVVGSGVEFKDEKCKNTIPTTKTVCMSVETCG